MVGEGKATMTRAHESWLVTCSAARRIALEARPCVMVLPSTKDRPHER
jgi:hypothetical protein